MRRKNFKKNFAIIIFLLTFFLNTNAIFGNTKDTSITHATEGIENIMSTILKNYMYDITIEELYEGAVFGMSLALDEYSNYINHSQLTSFITNITGDSSGIGISLYKKGHNFYVLTIMDNSSAKKSGVMEDDKILSVNGTDISKWEIEDVYTLIIDSKKEVSLSLQRKEKNFTVNIKKDTVKYSTVTGIIIDELIPDGNKNIGYISISSIEDRTSEDFEATVIYLKEKNVNKIILDLRNNPGGLLHESIDIAKQIVPKGAIVHTVDKKNIKKAYVSKLKEPPFDEIIVLINNNTASAAEIIAAALQDTGSTLVGEESFGKGVIQELFIMPDGDGISITIMEYLRRDGKKLNEIGITPDVNVGIPKYINSLDLMTPSSIKEILTYIDYPVGVGEDYDDITIESIKKFQKDNNIPVTGIVDEVTGTKINLVLYNNVYKKDVVIKKAYELINK